MFRNYFAAALRNLARNRLHAAINIVGMAVGFTAAILALLYVRDEFGFDRWIPGHEQVYRASVRIDPPDRASIASEPGPVLLAEWLKGDYKEVEATARLSHPWDMQLRRGQVEGNERLYWADPNFLTVVRLPLVAGDPAQALGAPDGLVLSRRLALKYFGRTDVIGSEIELGSALSPQRLTMRVLGVLEDLPSGTHFDVELLGSGLSRISAQSEFINNPDPLGNFAFRMHAYIRLAQGASAGRLQADMPAFLKRHLGGQNRAIDAGMASVQIMPIADIHFAPPAQFMFKPRGSIAAVYAILLVGALIVFIALINFVNLATARATRRSIEVGVRKAAGASQRTLIMQFVGETLLYCALSALLAVALVELLLPHFNAFLQRTIRFDYWSDPWLALGLLVLVLLAGLGGGLYPAFVLARFSPGRVLKQARATATERAWGRALLVVVQFSILIALVICSVVVYQQTQYSMTSALRLDRDHVLLVNRGCSQAFKDRVSALPGVRHAACSSPESLEMDIYTVGVSRTGGAMVNARRVRIDFGFFETFGLAPLAGRLFSQEYGADLMPERPASTFVPNIIINEAAVRALGLHSARQAVDQTVTMGGPAGPGAGQGRIVGVVPDYHFAANREAVQPAVYFVSLASGRFLHLSVKLTGERLPETLQAIDTAWRDSGVPGPINRRFIDQYVQDLYQAQTRQSALLTALSIVAVSIAALGLFGLTVFAAERRTKEIGVRKALGANTGNIVLLLLWQFSRPVLWANLIAWPVAALLMQRWLQGFAYRIDLPLWLFPAAGAAAILIALATVCVHCMLVARSKPVTALRYE